MYTFLYTEIDQKIKLKDRRKRKKRRKRRDEVIRNFKCYAPKCICLTYTIGKKSYGSEGALKFHIKDKHKEINYIPSYTVKSIKDEIDRNNQLYLDTIDQLIPNYNDSSKDPNVDSNYYINMREMTQDDENLQKTYTNESDNLSIQDNYNVPYYQGLTSINLRSL